MGTQGTQGTDYTNDDATELVWDADDTAELLAREDREYQLQCRRGHRWYAAHANDDYAMDTVTYGGSR